MNEFQSQTPHPDDDLLAGYLEGALLASEREEVEHHLSRCSRCRELAASLVPQREPAPAFEGFEASAAPAPVADRRVLPGPGSPIALALPWLLAAAALLLFLLIPGGGEDDGPPPRETRIAAAMLAAEAEELFSALRSPDAVSSSDQWHLGLRLEQPATVRVLAVLHDGRTMPVPLDGSGAEQLDLPADTNHAFGPYPRRFDGSSVSWLLVIAGGDDAEVAEIRAMIGAATNVRSVTEALWMGAWEAQFQVLWL
ncbi:MAG: zf-HC2 domain-containing protein [Planctomycetota bacterium]|nr:zf-HC2 domain-containing protein [Planctomycetota bacterium]